MAGGLPLLLAWSAVLWLASRKSPLLRDKFDRAILVSGGGPKVCAFSLEWLQGAGDVG